MELQSSIINDLAAALAKVQGEIKNPTKDAENPFFKSRYADLAGVWDACRAVLPKHGLSVTQTSVVLAEGPALVTTLLHSSGQWIRGAYPLTAAKQDPQGMGSAMTYARRYALAAIVGIAPEDDDAESAMGRDHGTSQTKTQQTQQRVVNEPNGDPGEFKNPYGNRKGESLRQMGEAEVRRTIAYWEGRSAQDGKPLSGIPAQLVSNAKAWLATLPAETPEQAPF